jgi:phosphodiesterase/alkaline phosphatase D-like protein
MVRRLALTALGVFGVLAGTLLFLSTSATAVTGHAFVGSFGSASSTTVSPEPLSSPTGVAVNNSSGRVYVVDRGNDRVEFFSSTGHYEGKFTGSDAPSGALLEPTAVVADQSGNVWVVDSGHNVVDEFTAAGVYIAGSQLTGTPTGEGGAIVPFSHPDGVAVDPSTGNPTSGDVFVADREHHYVDIFTQSGEYKSRFEPVQPPEPVHPPGSLAVDTKSHVYVTEPAANGGGEVKEYTVEGGLIQVTENFPNPNFLFDFPRAVAVDATTNDAYIANEFAVAEYDASASLIALFGTEAETKAPTTFGSEEAGGGIGVDSTTHTVFVANLASNDVEVFEEGERPPPPSTEEAREITAASATLRGTLGASSEEVEFYFSYAKGSSCSGSGATTTARRKAAGGSAESAIVTGLEPGAPYAFCLVAKNRFGETVGSQASFTTPPAVAGVTACTPSNETAEGATLGASLEPDGFPTKYDFEYGTSTAYGSQTEISQSAAPSGVVGAQAVVTGLEPNRTYDCRLAASREIEGTPRTTHGENGSFTTRRIPPGTPNEPAIRPAYEEAEAATLIARVNPENLPTTYQFQYAPNEDFQFVLNEGEGYDHATVEVAAGEGYGSMFVKTRIEGLRPGTTYRFRVVATNEAGTTYGHPQTFTTLTHGMPVLTVTASDLTQTGAVLSGTVNPEGYATGYTFQVGPSSGYGTQIAGQLAPGTAPDPVSATLEGLAPDATYHYRLVATNAKGTTYGEDKTFTTQPAIAPTLAPAAPSALIGPPTAPLIATPLIAFPTETGSSAGTTTPRKTTTKAQKLANALKACRKKPRRQRTSCQRQAHKRYGPAKTTRRRT